MRTHKAVIHNDIVSSTLASMPTATEVAELVDEYNIVLSELVEKHASLQSRRVTIHPGSMRGKPLQNEHDNNAGAVQDNCII